MPVIVRPRETSDSEALVRIAETVHRADGYPPHLPDGDLHKFLSAATALASWVAEREGEVAGHVALHPYSARSVMDLAAATTGRPADELSAVARLLVDPQARRGGIATALLDRATQESHALGLWPILDVAAHFAGAVAFYDACGWERAGDVVISFRDGTTLDSVVYIGPPPAG